ncbi:MAG: branched-chain amino acid ABC transporter permease [Actinomycetota bacterium]|nr:branched-chain amino acid ABC transporter permease [Actinomycetota bacterium]
MTADTFWALLGFGIITGSVTALAATGLTLLLGITKFLNFAYGEWLTIAAFVTLAVNVTLDLPLLVAVFAAVLFLAVFGPLANRIVFKPLTGRSPLTLLVTAIGLSFVLRNIVQAIWGTDVQRLVIPSFLFEPVSFGPFTLTTLNVLVIVISLIAMVALAALLNTTKLGRGMRAMADNPDLAQASGIPIDRVNMWTWVLGSILGALAGVMLAMTTQLSPNMGFLQLLVIASAVIVGGLGNVYGAVLAAFLIGISMELSTAFIDPSLKPGVAFLLLILVLLYRPQGLLGKVVG